VETINIGLMNPIHPLPLQKIFLPTMWKQFVAALMLISIALQSLNRVVIVGGYYAAAYAKNCENKARPEMKCGGRCQMMKKLRAQEKSDQQVPVSRNLEQALSSKSFFASVSLIAPPSLEHNSFVLLSPLPIRSVAHFHPPGKRLIILA
jgi:hypothetical protein